MTVTETQLRSAAALVVAVPELTCRLSTAGGARIVAGAADDAQVCAETFRELVVRSADAALTAATDLAIDGVDTTTGLAGAEGARYFVSPLPSEHTTAALRECERLTAPYFAMAKGDDELGLSVVRIGLRPAATPDHHSDLDEVALAAFSSCLVAHLIATTDAV